MQQPRGGSRGVCSQSIFEIGSGIELSGFGLVGGLQFADTCALMKAPTSETANASATRVVGRLRRRIGASNPGSSRERDADEPTFRLRTTETLRATTFFLRIREDHRATPRVSSPAPLARYDAIRQHTQLRALNAALCPL